MLTKIMEIAKKYGDLADCVFVHVEDGKIILFGSTYNQPVLRLHSSRYKKITPAKKQEQNMSLEGSTPLSHNSNGKAAVAISDVNDNSNIPQSETKSNPQSLIQNGNLYGFTYKREIYLNQEIMNSEVAVHEYTNLWNNYTQKK